MRPRSLGSQNSPGRGSSFAGITMLGSLHVRGTRREVARLRWICVLDAAGDRRCRGREGDVMFATSAHLILHDVTPIHWAVAGAVIALVTLTLLFVGNQRLGISTGFEDVCSAV